MYILIDFTKYYGGKSTMAYENFEDLKDSVTSNLNAKCWYDKESVDLRSIESCVRYLTKDAWNVSFKKSKSYDKFQQYRYGNRAMSL